MNRPSLWRYAPSFSRDFHFIDPVAFSSFPSPSKSKNARKGLSLFSDLLEAQVSFSQGETRGRQ